MLTVVEANITLAANEGLTSTARPRCRVMLSTTIWQPKLVNFTAFSPFKTAPVCGGERLIGSTVVLPLRCFVFSLCFRDHGLDFREMD